MSDRPAWLLRAEQTLRDRCPKPTACVGCGGDYRKFAHFWMGEDRVQRGPFCTECWRSHEGNDLHRN